jgi:hypothetical protein
MPEKNIDEDANESAIERHVDEMMDPKLPDASSKPVIPTAPDLSELDEKGEIDIFNNHNSVKKPDEQSEIPVHEPPAADKSDKLASVDDTTSDPLVDDIGCSGR